MKKSIVLAASVFTILALPIISSADEPTKMEKMAKMSKMPVEQRIQMHEDMAKANQDAADCLKANKPQMECAKNFKMSMEQMRKKYMPNVDKDMKRCMMGN